MTAPDATQAARLHNARIIANCVCSDPNCHGALVERRIGGMDLVVCAQGCRPAGYVKRTAAAQATHAALTLADEARMREPWLSKDRPTVAGQRPGLQALYGKEDDADK